MDQHALERLATEHDARAAALQTLLAQRVRRILLVASLYDSYTLSEGEHLAELILGASHNLALTSLPEIRRVSSRRRALDMLERERFDIVIAISHLDDIPAPEFGRRVKALHEDVPVILLGFDMRELRAIEGGPIAIPGVDRTFLWRGDVRLFLAIIMLVEDQLNVEHDTRVGGVRTLLLVEDSVPFYSSYLPMLFTMLMKQTELLISQSVNVGQRLLRRRLRPRVLMASTYEEGLALFERYRDTALAVISDVRFTRGGTVDDEAGIRLLQAIRYMDDDVPLLLQSSQDRHAGSAEELGVQFVHKHSETLLGDLRSFMLDHLGFGDFVFRAPDGSETERAKDVEEMIDTLGRVPDAVLERHAGRNHFSNWLMARTEFELASAMRKLQVSDFPSVAEMRDYLVQSLERIRDEHHRGQIEDYLPDRYASGSRFVRIGTGSLGGKGRGLAFMHELLSRGNLDDDFQDLRIFVPPSAIIATQVFDDFLERNDLAGFALRETDDEAILDRFLAADLPPRVAEDLADFMAHVRYPIAVRSSSLLEDSHHLPAAGVYPTHMLANNEPSAEERLAVLLDALRHIYASTFFRAAKTYFASTPSRLEDEKMAVVVQQVVGRRHGDRVYPHMSGVAQSHNFYPVRDMQPEEGIATVALGFGRTVVEGGRAIRFSPAHPQWLPQFSSSRAILHHAQRRFWALDLDRARPDFHRTEPEEVMVELDLAAAEEDGALWPVASTYDANEDTVYDGLARPGARLVTLAPVLKHGAFPLAGAIRQLLELGRIGMAGPVEIEFAANVGGAEGQGNELAFLQIRPLQLTHRVGEALDVDGVEPEEVFLRSEQVLGVGHNTGIRDIVAVRADRFDRAETREIAEEVGRLTARLQQAGRPYLLIGPGRWGTSDRWLGIPVSWAQISGAQVIVECPLDDLEVEPSQGTHFFHNMTSLGIGYFTLGARHGGYVDEAWLADRRLAAETERVRHLALDEPLEVRIDGATNRGVVLKRLRGADEVG